MIDHTPNRIAIVVKSDLSAGAVANVAAILCGQVGRSYLEYFSGDVVYDQDRGAHAAPKYSVVILKAKNSNQLRTLLTAQDECHHLAFSKVGQSLNNAFDSYARQLAQTPIVDTGLLGVAVFGRDEDVKKATRKFSVLA